MALFENVRVTYITSIQSRIIIVRTKFHGNQCYNCGERLQWCTEWLIHFQIYLGDIISNQQLIHYILLETPGVFAVKQKQICPANEITLKEIKHHFNQLVSKKQNNILLHWFPGVVQFWNFQKGDEKKEEKDLGEVGRDGMVLKAPHSH